MYDNPCYEATSQMRNKHINCKKSAFLCLFCLFWQNIDSIASRITWLPLAPATGHEWAAAAHTTPARAK
jgi:hypothetical protein